MAPEAARLAFPKPPRRGAATALTLVLAFAAADADAARRAKEQPTAEQIESGQAGMLLDADSVTYDNALDIVTARGHVRIVKDDRILFADTVSYNQGRDVVTASGHVRITDPSKAVYFGDYMELTGDLKTGFVENVRGVLADNSRMAGTVAERLDEHTTRMAKGVYSPCDLCKENPERPPVWQLKAYEIVHNQEDKKVEYYNAYLELFGVPIIYSPYLSHADPSVKAQSGFLSPRVGFKTGLGTLVRSYYYLNLAPDYDATVETSYFSSVGPTLGLEFRERFEHGLFSFAGSVTDVEHTASNSYFGVDTNKTLRGHFFSQFRYDIDDNWRSGVDLARSSDIAYLREFDYSPLDVLQSRIYTEGFFGRDYASVNVYDTQDLRPGTREPQPLVAPYVTYSMLGDPGETAGGRWSLDLGLLQTRRTTGELNRRVSVDGGWERQFIGDEGIVTNVDGLIYADGYDTHNGNRNNPLTAPYLTASDGQSGRFFPQLHVVSAYPLSQPLGLGSWLVQPEVALTDAPGIAHNSRIPNEDSRDDDLDVSNLFLANRTPGIDRLESGARVTYGFRTGLYNYPELNTNVFFGQSYRLDGSRKFPAGSGLEARRSDYVGELQLFPKGFFELDYRVRLDSKNFTSKAHDFTITGGPPIFTVTLNYVFINSIENPTLNQNRNEAQLIVFSNFAPRWTAVGTARYAFGQRAGLLQQSLGIAYTDECFVFGLNAYRNLTDRLAGTSSSSLIFRIAFRGLGEIHSPSLAG